jgi:hypothetical protein
LINWALVSHSPPPRDPYDEEEEDEEDERMRTRTKDRRSSENLTNNAARIAEVR